MALLETSSNGRISPWGKLWFIAESLWKATGEADFETSLEKIIYRNLSRIASPPTQEVQPILDFARLQNSNQQIDATDFVRYSKRGKNLL